MGEPLAALGELDAARHPAPGVVDDGPRTGMQAKVGLALRRIGRLQQARVAIAGEADRLLEQDNPRLGSAALSEEAAILTELGETAPAREKLERAIAILEKRGGGACCCAPTHILPIWTPRADGPMPHAPISRSS